MKSISQIGKAALSRIFKPEQKGSVDSGSNYEFERTVRFFQDHGNLKIPYYDEEETEKGCIVLLTQFKVWSIELGLQNVNIEDTFDTNLYKAIHKDYSTKPTHIIVVNKRKYSDFYDHYVVENEDVCIYRVDMSKVDCYGEDSFHDQLINEQLMSVHSSW